MEIFLLWKELKLKNKKPLFIIISFNIIVFSLIAPLLCICCKINFNNTLNSETTKTNKNEVESSTTSILNNMQKQNTSSSNKLNLLNFRGIDFYPYPVPYSDKETANSLTQLLNIQEIITFNFVSSYISQKLILIR